MKIISLKAENVKKLKAVEIIPTDNTVVITGKNGQGKSSVLDSILYALGGKDALKDTPKPIRDGQDHASVELDLGDYKVVRTWSNSGTTRLEVYSKEGAKFTSPQTLLDEIVGRIAFDPLEFANMKPEEQKSVLLDLLNLTDKVAELQTEYKAKSDERTLVGRDLKNAEGSLASLPTPDGVIKPVDTLELSNRLRAAQEHNRSLEDMQGALEDAEADIADLEEQLKEAKKVVADSKAKLKGKKPIDTKDLEAELSNAGETNRKYEASKSYANAKELAEKYRKEQTELTTEITKIIKKKDDLITSAKLPIDGLNIDAEGVTYNKIPFTQLSSAEQLKISLAIAMSMNPKLKVMRIMDGSLLDSDNMAIIKEMAKADDYQVWIERVEDSSNVGILLEDGEVK